MIGKKTKSFTVLQPIPGKKIPYTKKAMEWP